MTPSRGHSARSRWHSCWRPSRRPSPARARPAAAERSPRPARPARARRAPPVRPAPRRRHDHHHDHVTTTTTRPGRRRPGRRRQGRRRRSPSRSQAPPSRSRSPARARTTLDAARADPPLSALLQGPRDRVLEQPAHGPGDRRARPARPLPHAGLLGVLPARRGEERARDAARRARSPDAARTRGDDPGGRRERADRDRRIGARALEALRADHGPRGAGAAGARRRRAGLDDAGDVGVRRPRDVDLVPQRLRRRQPGEHRRAGAGGRRSRRSTSRAPTAARTSGRSSRPRSSPRSTRSACRSAPGSTSTATTRWARPISGSGPRRTAPTAS